MLDKLLAKKCAVLILIVFALISVLSNFSTVKNTLKYHYENSWSSNSTTNKLVLFSKCDCTNTGNNDVIENISTDFNKEIFWPNFQPTNQTLGQNKHLNKFCGCERSLSKFKFFNNSQNSQNTTKFPPLIVGDFQRDFVSTCSSESDLRGFDQLVISYTLFNANNGEFQDYTKGILENMNSIKKFYSHWPDQQWVARIYSDIMPKPNDGFCQIICEFEFLDWCYINDLPENFRSNLIPTIWRFLPLGDPTVKTFLSRDIDASPDLRERTAVLVWEQTDKSIHIMRDSKWQGVEMQAGMWGWKNDLLGYEKAVKIRSDIIKNTQQYKDDAYGDQILLKNFLYSKLDSSEFLQHDGYFCKTFKNSIPWPTKRQNLDQYVGFQRNRKVSKYKSSHLCPVECRPEYGKNFDHC